MKISIKNIGKIANAVVDIKTVSVITGDNNSGKSTVGRMLYSITDGLNKLSLNNLLEEKVEVLVNELRAVSRFIDVDLDYNILYDAIYEEYVEDGNVEYFKEKDIEIISLVKKIVEGVEKQSTKLSSNIIGRLDEIKVVSQIPFDSVQQMFRILQSSIESEFRGNPLTKASHINFSEVNFIEDNGDVLKLDFTRKKLFENSSLDLSRNYQKSVYIDDPFVIDSISGRPFLNTLILRRQHLAQLLKGSLINRNSNYFSGNIDDDRVENIFKTVLGGDLIIERYSTSYIDEFLNDKIDITNLSAGMKAFLIIKVLLQSGHLSKAEFLILDEPEIHLHPMWQVAYAQLIALLVKNMPIRILVTTHSPYFLEALEAYLRLYEVEEFKFYKSEAVDNGLQELIDVTHNLEPIYKTMWLPYKKIDKVREVLSEREDDID